MSQSDWVVRMVIPTAPDSSLLPNRAYRRGGFHQRIESARDLRTMASIIARSSAPPRPLIGPIQIDAKIIWPRRRKYVDFDAAVASLKPVLDGCTDASWWIDDSQVTGMTVVQDKSTIDTGSITLIAYINSHGEEVNKMPAKKTPAKKEKMCPECGKPMSKCKC